MAKDSKISFSPVADPVWVHPLTSPVTYGATEIGEIAVRKPNGRDLLYYGSPVIADPTSDKDARLDFAVTYKLISALSGLPEKVLQEADVADIVDLGWKIGSFFHSGLAGPLAGPDEIEGPLLLAGRAARRLGRIYKGTSVFEFLDMPEDALWRFYADTAEDLRRERQEADD